MKKKIVIALMVLCALLLSACDILDAKTEKVREELAEMVELPNVILEE